MLIAQAQPALNLHLYTALSLARPAAASDLERRFVAPFSARHFGADYPDLAYVELRRQGLLPPNVRVSEFYLQSGSLLDCAPAQRDYASKNPHAIQALFAASVEDGEWLKAHVKQAAAQIAPLQGLPVEVVELALQRQAFNVKPITPAVAADQQKIADTFFDLKLIPRAIKVSDAVLVDAKH